jgi:hypothetical protein
MMQSIALSGICFGRNIIGIVTRPYETYRRIIAKGSVWELGYVGVLLTMYFITATIVKNPYFRPFFLTRQFIVLSSAAGSTFCLAIILFALMGKLLKSEGSLKGLFLGWGYNLIPTLCWFWVTSLLYVILPPPRTTGFLGIAFSVVYLMFSSVILFWKIILSYLTIRFGLRFDLQKILLTWAVVLPVMFLYSIFLYRLGIFKIPFI